MLCCTTQSGTWMTAKVTKRPTVVKDGNKHTNKQTEKWLQTNKQTERWLQTNEPTEKWLQTDKQTNRKLAANKSPSGQ